MKIFLKALPFEDKIEGTPVLKLAMVKRLQVKKSSEKLKFIAICNSNLASQKLCSSGKWTVSLKAQGQANKISFRHPCNTTGIYNSSQARAGDANPNTNKQRVATSFSTPLSQSHIFRLGSVRGDFVPLLTTLFQNQSVISCTCKLKIVFGLTNIQAKKLKIFFFVELLFTQ